MRSRTARLILGVTAWVAIGAAAFFIFRFEQQTTARQAAIRMFDLHAREATDALADVRAGQQAYVAVGQGVAFWVPKVATRLDDAAGLVNDLRQTALTVDGREALDQALTTIADFRGVDKRARDYVKSDQPLMATDVIFTEGGEAVQGAARQVERARVAEHQAADAAEAGTRRIEAISAAGSAAFAALLVIVLVPVPRPSAEETAADTVPAAGLPTLREAAPSSSARTMMPAIKSAVQVCTDLARVSDAADLNRLLGNAAEAMDATGLVVWLGNASGVDLRPVLSHGYGAPALARMPAVPRSADNAAAAAYRSGKIQIVLERPGSSAGAIVAPLLAPEGCVGALSAEIRGGGETSDAVQAIAALVAAQLSSVLAAAPAAVERKAAGA